MAKQRLGEKKEAAIERILGMKVRYAFANGYGRPHGWAEVWLMDRTEPVMVNWHTGETSPYADSPIGRMVSTLKEGGVIPSNSEPIG